MACIAIKDCRREIIILRNSVGDQGVGRSAQTRGVFANDSIDSYTKAITKRKFCKGER